MVFLILLFIQFGVMTWLVLYPGPAISWLLQLYNISDMNFKLLLVSLAALNFLICFVMEVSDLYGASQIPCPRTSVKLCSKINEIRHLYNGCDRKLVTF